MIVVDSLPLGNKAPGAGGKGLSKKLLGTQIHSLARSGFFGERPGEKTYRT